VGLCKSHCGRPCNGMMVYMLQPVQGVSPVSETNWKHGCRLVQRDDRSFAFLSNSEFWYIYKTNHFAWVQVQAIFLLILLSISEEIHRAKSTYYNAFLGIFGKNPFGENFFREQTPAANSCDARSKQHFIIAPLQVYRRSNKIFNTNFFACAC